MRSAWVVPVAAMLLCAGVAGGAGQGGTTGKLFSAQKKGSSVVWEIALDTKGSTRTFETPARLTAYFTGKSKKIITLLKPQGGKPSGKGTEVTGLFAGLSAEGKGYRVSLRTSGGKQVSLILTGTIRVQMRSEEGKNLATAIHPVQEKRGKPAKKKAK